MLAVRTAPGALIRAISRRARGRSGKAWKPPEQFTLLTEADAIGRWWDPAHTFSHDSRNLSLEAKPAGCLCERLPDGGGVEHMLVVYASPGKLLRLTGAIGPLQEAALAGTMTWTLSQAGETTRVELSYAVGGFRVGGFRDLPAVVDGVLRGQLLRLKAFVETGRPDASSR